MKRMHPKSTILVLLPALAVLLSGAAAAQDLEGTWDLQATVFIDQQEGNGGDCLYEGTADFTQVEDMVSGSPTLDLVEGDTEICPEELFGDLEGTAGDGGISGTISGEQGSLDFSGKIFGPVGLEEDDEVAGGFDVTQGPFAGSFGDFEGQRMAGVPTLGAGGIALLALILLTAGSLLLARRQRGTQPS